MTLETVTKHGHAFTIDTMDWPDQGSADKAHDVLDNFIFNLDAEDAEILHELLSDEDTFDRLSNRKELGKAPPIFIQMEDATFDAWQAATMDWLGEPNVNGCNTEISAA